MRYVEVLVGLFEMSSFLTVFFLDHGIALFDNRVIVWLVVRSMLRQYHLYSCYPRLYYLL